MSDRRNVMTPYRRVFLLSFFVLLAVSMPLVVAHAEDIVCEGSYGGHLQGLDCDGEHIYWSFTVALVKTDMNGKLLASVEAPRHQGDLVVHDGRLYVAVNLGKFNQEPGEADSWIYVYDAGDLSLLEKHEAQEVVHGAGGMAFDGERFIVVGGLPENYDENYVYEYDTDLRFVKRHVIASGQTRKGIQTACYAEGQFWFGCYGYPDNAAILVTDGAFNLTAQLDTKGSIGIAGIGDSRFLQGHHSKNEDGKSWQGKVRVLRFDRSLIGRFVRDTRE